MALFSYPSIQLRSSSIFALSFSLFLTASCADDSSENYKPSSQPQAAVASYYASVSVASGNALFSSLSQIIGSNTRRLSYDGALDAIKDVDTDPSDSDNVLLIYTGESRDKRLNVGGGKSNMLWNREHVWPQSRGAQSYKSDVHNLWPADARLNSIRGNKDFDDGGDLLDWVADTHTSRSSFEPSNDFKGEAARVLFYMATRYSNLSLNDQVGNGDHSLGRLCRMLEWNEEDPVSDHEKNRNDAIYERWQKNRNPFVDHPEWARLIWGQRCQS